MLPLTTLPLSSRIEKSAGQSSDKSYSGADHLKLLLRYGGEIFFCYDSDEAGQRATVRAMSVLSGARVDAKVIVVPDGKDPDEYVRKHGAEAFLALADKAVPLAEHRLSYILAHADLDLLSGKLQAVSDALPVLAATANEARRTEYTKRLARRLLLDEDSIRSELRKYLRQPPERIATDTPQRTVKRKRDNAILNAERIVIRTMYREPATAEYILALLPDGLPSRVGRELTEFLRGGNVGNTESLSEEANAELSRAMNEGTGGADESAAYDDAVNKLRRHYLEGEYRKLSLRAEEFYRRGDEDGYRETMKEIGKINAEIREVS